MMKKTLIAIAAFSFVAAVVPSHVEARDGAVAAGVIGGIAAGVIIGGAMASQPPRYQYEPAYENPRPVYVAPTGSCVVAQEIWSDRHQAYVVRNVRAPC